MSSHTLGSVCGEVGSLKKASQIHKHLYEVRERTSCHTAAAPCTPSQSAVMTYTSYGNHEPLITYR